MKREEIIHMAHEAGLIETMPAEREYHAVWSTSTAELQRFAKLVEAAYVERTKYDGIHTCSHLCQRPFCVALREAVAAEREACAEVCEAYIAPSIGLEMAAAIRARGNHD